MPQENGQRTRYFDMSEFLIERYATVCMSSLVKLKGIGHCPTRHGDVVFQLISSFDAQSVDLSV
jgi:hypothetical protein